MFPYSYFPASYFAPTYWPHPQSALSASDSATGAESVEGLGLLDSADNAQGAQENSIAVTGLFARRSWLPNRTGARTSL